MVAAGGEADRPAPSGRQLELRCGDHHAVLVTVGGGIRVYRHGGQDVLDGYPETAMADGGRGQLLMPWPNRIRDGRYRWDGGVQQLALTEPERAHAIHGLVRWSAWSVVTQTPRQARLELELPPQPGYPFTLELAVDYRLDEGGLTVTQSARNAGGTPCPYASGCHPYLAAGAGRVDELQLRVPAATRLVTDKRAIPTGRRPVRGEDDFRTLRRIGGAVLDLAYTDLERDASGSATVTLQGRDRGAEVWADAAHTFLMVFTGDTLAAGRRRRGLAVEPMTAAPDAFNSGDGLRVLEPGDEFAATWGIRPLA